MVQNENKNYITKYNIRKIWYKSVEHNFSKKDRVTADARVELLIKLCGVEDIREIDQNPAHQ